MKFNLAELLQIATLPQYLEAVERDLSTTLASDNPYISDAVERLLEVRGKRLRPSLILAVAACGDKVIDEKLVAAGAAIELVHLGSLVHDDIIDDSPTRWNRPTTHRTQGMGQAIVLGDYLLAKACVRATSVDAATARDTATAIAMMCEGQSHELADEYNEARTIDSYMHAIEGKTAALISAACRMGAWQAGFNESEIAAFSAYGKAFGVAYQLVDDVLDLISSEHLYGKPTGADIRQGVYTLPLLFALKESANFLEKNSENLADQLVQNGHIQKTIHEAIKHAQLARKAIQHLQGNATAQGLQELPLYYVETALRSLTVEKYRGEIEKLL